MYLSFVLSCWLLGFAFASPWERIQVGKQVSDDTALKFQPESTEAQWAVFKSKHNKKYSQDEEERRLKIFEANLKRIEMHNYLHEKGERTFRMGINEYADMESNEFTQVMNGLLPRNLSNPRVTDRVDYMSPLVNLEIPDSVDWRTKGYVTPVKNQGHCGSCWSFSTTGALEGQHFRKTGNLVSLSEQNLIDCSKKWGNNGCNGGLMDYAFQYVKDNDGIDTENSYPYMAKDEPQCHFKSSAVGATDLGYKDIARGDEDMLKQAVASEGPISIAIDASHQSFQLYESGVYMEPKCSSKRLDHGVLIVGYGTDSDSGLDYWIVKNSWGPGWGNNGYVWMARNQDNQCGVASQASYPLM